MSALSSDDPDFFKLLRYDLQALGNATEGTDEEDPPGNDEDDEYESFDEEDEENVDIDPIRVYDTILQKGRFPTSIISKVDLMQQEATNSILDEEFWEWVNQSREKVKMEKKEQEDEDMQGSSSRHKEAEKPHPSYSAFSKVKADLEMKVDKIRDMLLKKKENKLKDEDKDKEPEDDEEQIYISMMKELGADFRNSDPPSKYKFCPWCSNMLQIHSGSTQSKDSWRWKCLTCPYSCPIPGQQRFVTLIERDSDDEEQQIVDTSKANEHRQKTEILCPKCNFREAYFYQMQTRSADEPMTTFYECCNRTCGNHWRD